jgi:isopenicillin-N epimerase
VPVRQAWEPSARLACRGRPWRICQGAEVAGRRGSPARRALFRLVKKAFVLDPRLTYMNVGTTGSVPRHVLKAYEENARLVARNPRENLGGSGAMREALAPQFGCNADEIVISENTTAGMCFTLNGVTLGMEEGDAIITTNHEHSAGRAPMALLRDRRGVEIIPVTLPVGSSHTAQDYVDLFAPAITSARSSGFVPKMLLFSAPTYVTGTMLPIRRLTDLAISEGIHTLVDGAHATGMFNLDLHALGIDFFAASGHKWQCGPGGTGIWYIRNQNESSPLPLPNFYPTYSSAYGSGETIPVPDGGREPPEDYNVRASTSRTAIRTIPPTRHWSIPATSGPPSAASESRTTFSTSATTSSS